MAEKHTRLDLYAYRPICTLSESQKAHKRHWDRARQREYRTKAKTRVTGLEADLQSLQLRLKIVEEERNHLRDLLAEKNILLASSEEIRKERDILREIIASAYSAMQATPGAPTILPGSTVIDTDFTVQSNPRLDTLSGGLSQLDPEPNLHGTLPNSISTDSVVQHPTSSVSSDNSFGDLLDTWPLPLSYFPDESARLWDDDTILRVDSPHFPSTLDQPVVKGSWSILPPNTAPICPLDEVIWSIEREFRNVTSQKTCLSEFSASSFPRVSSLLNPSPSLGDPRQFISNTVFSRIMTQMPVKETNTRLAAMWVICNLIRWRLCLTLESYAALPTFLHPTEAQMRIPHPFWVDTIIWPEVRERLLEEFDYSDYKTFNAFRVRLGGAISVSWPRALPECLTSTGTSGEYSLSADFQAHLCNVANWTVDPDFIKDYPLFKGAINIRDL